MKKSGYELLAYCLGGLLLLPLGGCSYLVYAFVRNTTNAPVVVWLTKVGAQPTSKFPGLFRNGHYGNTLLYRPKLVRPTLRSVSRMHDSLLVQCSGATIRFCLPPRSTVSLGYFVRLQSSSFSVKLQRADSSVQVLDSTALAKASHFGSRGGHRFWIDIR